MPLVQPNTPFPRFCFCFLFFPLLHSAFFPLKLGLFWFILVHRNAEIFSEIVISPRFLPFWVLSSDFVCCTKPRRKAPQRWRDCPSPSTTRFFGFRFSSFFPFGAPVSLKGTLINQLLWHPCCRCSGGCSKSREESRCVCLWVGFTFLLSLLLCC